MDHTIETSAEAAEAHAMPRFHEVHSDPDQPCMKAAAKALGDKPGDDKSPAQWAYERMILYIQNFEKTLDEEHEVAMGFVGGDAGVLRIEGMGYFDPNIVTFYGEDASGAHTQLIQNVGQLSVILRALSKPAKVAAPNRIGFRLAEDLAKA